MYSRRSRASTPRVSLPYIPAHFDVVIVDEFHHAAAPSYRALLEHVQPTELLGLTATPERSDGLPLLDWFDNRIAAELRLWDADRQAAFCSRPSPTSVFTTGSICGRCRGAGAAATTWKGLTNLFTSNDAWARQVVAQVHARGRRCAPGCVLSASA